MIDGKSVSKEAFERMKSKAYGKGFRQGYSKALEEAKNVVKKHMGMYKGYSFNNEMELIQEELDELKAGGKNE